MTTRRQILLAGAVCCTGFRPAALFAQYRLPRIGMLSPLGLKDSVLTPHVVQRLEELGYGDGKSMHLEYRSAEGHAERFAPLARQLVDVQCDLVFAIGPEHAAKSFVDLRSTIPLVFYANDYDPLRAGIVKSLTRREAYVTGVYVPQDALVAKRFQLLREVVPSARRFLVLSDVFSQDQLAAVRAAAQKLRLEVIDVEFAKLPYDIESAFERGRKGAAQAVVLLTSPMLARRSSTISALAIKNRLPSIGSVAYVENRMLLGFGQHRTKGPRRVAELGVRILKGAKPSDLPVEQDDEFELVINAMTAAAIGVKIPPGVSARATRIIK